MLLICLAASVLQGQTVTEVGAERQSAEVDEPLAPVASDAVAVDAVTAELGLAGMWKLGHLSPVRVNLPSGIADKVTAIEVHSVDGDGVTVVYRQDVDASLLQHSLSDPLQQAYVWVPVRIGRLGTPVAVRVMEDSQVLGETELDTQGDDAGLPSDQPLVLALGSAMGIEQLSRNSVSNSTSTFSTAVLRTVDQIPADWRYYAACDLLVISGADDEFLSAISTSQWAALEHWVRGGGGCVISLGESTNPASGLQRFLPGEIVGSGQVSNPGTLESMVATDAPLPGFSASILELGRGEVELSFADTLGRDIPWWIRYAYGHGTIQLVTSSLDAPAFSGWKDRRLLWGLLIEPYVDREMITGDRQSSVGESSYRGYSDLVGQLRATLDNFSGVSGISFSLFVALLIGVLLLIGPVDYFVSVKWLQRPHLSWYFAGTSLLLICSGLTWFYHSIRPDELQVNAAQLIDIDVSTGQVQGRLWSHVYSGAARTVSVRANATDAVPHVSANSAYSDWQGLPGAGLGGLLSQLSTDRGMPSYVIDVQGDGGSVIKNVGIPSAGTKSFVTTWDGQLSNPRESQLTEIPGVDQLTGVLVNPLDVDLKEPMLFYHNWYYSLASRIPPGESLSIAYDTIPKDIARRLHRRRNVDGSDVVTPWDPNDRDALDRLLELMMFHKVASGRSYTSLSHRYQAGVDHSNLMRTDQAVLVARVDAPWASLDVSSGDSTQGGENVEVKRGIDRVWCRILIPVSQATADR
ncbi:hypothetical protein [Aureliella helgolandensis]|nr:hypothetical protein [Aureliella helgolandensis]